MSDEYKRTSVCGCGATFEAKDRWQRSCDICVAARKAFEAARPTRICKKCGVQTQHFKARLCAACYEQFEAEKDARHKAYLAKSREEEEEKRRRRQEDPKPKEKTDDELREWLDKRLDRQDEAYGGRYGYGASLPKRKSAQDAPINPEQVDHADQDAIDAQFSDLMEGFDL